MKLLLPGALLAGALLLAGGIAYEAFAPLDPVVLESARPPARRAAAIAAPYIPPGIEFYADIDARPLFSAHRQPLNDPQASASMQASSDFVLVGVIMGGERAVALLRSKSTQATMSAVVGDLVNGWRVARIDPTTVTLKAKDGEFVVPLDGPANQPPSAPLQPAANPSAAPAAAPSAPSAAPRPAAGGTQTANDFPLDPIIPPPAPKPATPPKPAAAAPGKPGLPATGTGGTISPEALKGAPRDPTTGEPTL